MRIFSPASCVVVVVVVSDTHGLIEMTSAPRRKKERERGVSYPGAHIHSYGPRLSLSFVLLSFPSLGAMTGRESESQSSAIQLSVAANRKRVFSFIFLLSPSLRKAR